MRCSSCGNCPAFTPEAESLEQFGGACENYRFRPLPPAP